MIFASPARAPAPAQAKLFLRRRPAVEFLPGLPLFIPAFDAVTVALVFSLLFLSLLSVSFILHLRFKSRRSIKLQSFASNWTVRFLMILFISLWAFNELLRLPVFQSFSLFPHQMNLCRAYVILSLGLYEPGFLLTVSVLVSVSIRKRNFSLFGGVWLVGITCFPLLISLYFAVYHLPEILPLPALFYRTGVAVAAELDTEIVLCTYPLTGTVIFGVFGVVYALAFWFSCWRVVSLAINKRLRNRVMALAATMPLCLAAEMVALTASAFWVPNERVYHGFVLVVFLSVLTCAVVGQGVLVIRPIADALDVECRSDGGQRRVNCV